MTNKHIHDKPQFNAHTRYPQAHTRYLNAHTRYPQYAEALASRQDASFGSRFNGPHVLTDRHGWTARCCGTVEGCKWCANEAAYMGRPLAPTTVAVVGPSEVFMECDTCRAKPGNPTLCAGCLHNRDVISQYHRVKLTRSFSDVNVGYMWTAAPPATPGCYWFYWGVRTAKNDCWVVELRDTGKWHSTYFDPAYSTAHLTQMNGRWWPVRINSPLEAAL